MSETLKNPREAIGHKIAWYCWHSKTYLILEDIKGNELHGTWFDGKQYVFRDTFTIGRGIKEPTEDYRELRYWYIIDNFERYEVKLEDKLFDI